MADSREVGRYGTIHYMKRLIPNSPVVAFPIDDESVTFGRDSTCNIRLYYPDISPIHCKVFFEDRKAFIAIHGTNGIVVDGCHVYPNSSSPCVVPLLNYSEFEIRSKTFRFTYPPKEIRAALLATPTGSDSPRRALRLSMIQSAVVFSPRPSPDPQENLRVLQSPMRLFNNSGQPAAADEEFILVEGSTPRVVEEEKDLVICEDIVVDTAPMDTGTPPGFRSMPVSPSKKTNNIQTPRRPVNSLHRAVLIRSAKKAILRAEMEQRDAEEEEEVENFMTSDFDMMDEEDEEDEQEHEEDADHSKAGSSTGWSKSLGAVRSIVWSFNPPTSPPDFDDDDDDEVEDMEEDDQGEHHESESEHDQDLQGEEARESMDSENQENLEEPRRNFSTSFSTPQAKQRTSIVPVRFSIGGPGELRKINLEPTWRVNDIVLPEEPEQQVKQEEIEQSPRVVAKLTKEEREAIRERRRSALAAPDPFFAGHTPGTRPRQSIGTRLSTPLKTAGQQSSYDSKVAHSPFPALGTSYEQSTTSLEEDTETLMSQIQARTEEARRRKSDATPHRSLPDLQRSPRKRPAEFMRHIKEDVDEDQDQNMEETSSPADTSAPESQVDVLVEPLAQASNAGLQTPLLRGVRELFHQRQVPGTPSFEGMADMMKLPQPPPIEESTEPHSPEEASSPTLLTRKRAAAAKGRPPKVVQADTPSLADDEASPIPGGSTDSDEPLPAKAPALRLLRSRKQPSGADGKDNPASKTCKSPIAAKGAASSSSATLPVPSAEETTDNPEALKPATRRTRKTVLNATPAVPQSRKGKQATASETPDSVRSTQSDKGESSKATTKTTTRSTRATAKSRVKAEPVEESLPPSEGSAAALGTRGKAKVTAAAKPRTTRTTIKKGTAAGSDSQAADSQGNTGKENAQEEDGAAPSKPQRTTRRTPAAASEKQIPTTRVTRARTKTT